MAGVVRPLPAETLESCTWDVAAPERTAFQAPRGGGAAGAGPAMGDPTVAAHARWTIAIRVHFAAIRVDPVHNEVVVMDDSVQHRV
jgi:hypothetical protein